MVRTGDPGRTRAPELVLFDLGNTLVDYHAGPRSDEEKDILGLGKMSDLLGAWGVRRSVDELRLGFYEPWMKVMPDRGRRDREFDVTDFLRDVVPSHLLDREHILSLMLRFHEPSAEDAVAAPDAAQGLEALRKR